MNVASFAVRARRFAPGLLLSFAVALSATLLEPLLAQAIFATTGAAYKLPAMVIALLIGIALHPIALNKRFAAGITYAVKILLRIAIALLGLRIALSDIVALGLWTPLLIMLSMAITLVAAMALARVLGQNPGVGALMGAANAICGASATLATSTVLPSYKNKDVDVAFTVIAANAVSTIVMVLYPPLCILLGYTPQQTGIMLGATIHDMAQVVGAGYAVSEPVGNSAVIVKLFRVFMLLPVVLMIGWYFVGRDGESHAAKVPVPIFAVVFLGLCIANSIIPSLPGAATIYEPIRNVLILLSTWGLLIAIGALGLGTSVTALGSIGWRHVVIFTGATIVILVIVLAGLALL